MTALNDYLDLLFGSGDGEDIELRADTSTQLFVRGRDHLTLDHSARATGRRITAREALDAYGWNKLQEIIDRGSAVISASLDAAGLVLRRRREDLGLKILDVAKAAGVSTALLSDLEKSASRPIQDYERVARALGLDERMLSFNKDQVGNQSVAVRLRTLSSTSDGLSPRSVVALAEAAWVAATQLRIERRLGIRSARVVHSTNADFGEFGRPPYRVGYELADRVRQEQGLGNGPIYSMRELCEVQFGLPVIFTRMPETLAGATVEVDGGRAVVLNLAGPNENPLVRRSTLAHELCHLLFDPPSDLRSLRVDGYSDINVRIKGIDKVEARANAFAVQLLAPQNAAVERFEEFDWDLNRGVVDHYGISFTAGRYQIWNGLDREVTLEEIGRYAEDPQPDWEAREIFTLTYHPVKSLMERPARAGTFSAVVIRAAEERQISWDTASHWLGSNPDELRASIDQLRGLYPTVWPESE